MQSEEKGDFLIAHPSLGENVTGFFQGKESMAFLEAWDGNDIYV